MDLPEVGDLVPKVDGTFIEHNGRTFFRCKVSQIPDHEIVRIGWRLYAVGEYVGYIDAWEVKPFTIDISDAERERWMPSGDD